MKRRLIIDLACAGMLSAVMLTGCGSNATQYCNSGIEKFNESEYSDAVEEFQKAVDKEPSNSSYLVYLGMAQIETNQYTEAVNSFTSAIESDSKNRDAYRGLGIAYYSTEDYADAIVNFKNAIDMSSDKFDDIHIDALKYYGRCLYEQGQYQDAVDIYTTLLAHCSKADEADVYYMRGSSYIKLKDENNAVLDYEASLKADDSDYNVYCSMYSAFMNAGYTDRAESYLKRIIDNESSDNLTIGKIYYALGSYEDAETYLKKAVDEEEEEAEYYLAMNYEAQQDYTDAEALYLEYLGSHPNDSNIYNQYGVYLINRSKYDSALVYIETGLELNKDEAKQQLLYNQAVCYEYTGDYAKALTLFKDYTTAYPDDKAAQREYEFLLSR